MVRIRPCLLVQRIEMRVQIDFNFFSFCGKGLLEVYIEKQFKQWKRISSGSGRKFQSSLMLVSAAFFSLYKYYLISK